MKTSWDLRDEIAEIIDQKAGYIETREVADRIMDLLRRWDIVEPIAGQNAAPEGADR